MAVYFKAPSPKFENVYSDGAGGTSSKYGLKTEIKMDVGESYERTLSDKKFDARYETLHDLKFGLGEKQLSQSKKVSSRAADGWKVYNFEVEKHHTYIADGVRVHNESYSFYTDPFTGETLADMHSTFGVESIDVARFQKIHASDQLPPDTIILPTDPAGKGGHGNYEYVYEPGHTFEGEEWQPGGDFDGDGHLEPADKNLHDADLYDRHADWAESEGDLKKAEDLREKAERERQEYEENDDGSPPLPADAGLPDYDPNNACGTTAPVILDLNGNGIQLSKLTESSHFEDTNGDGLENRTAWADVGDAVLFYDPDGVNDIFERSQYIFTEWDPTAESDMDALRSVFDSNGDGVLDAQDAAYHDFKLMVTNADGSTSVVTLAQAGITSIDLTPDTTNIELPDGSVITGQATFTYADGSTGTVGEVTLISDGNSYRLTQAETFDGNGTRTEISTAFDASGAIAFIIISTTTADGSSVVNEYDDDGDGVVDRVQTIDTVTHADGSVSKSVQNYVGAELASAVLINGEVTTTSADGLVVTIDRDSKGGGWPDQREEHIEHANGSRSVEISQLSSDGDVILSTTETISVDGLTRIESIDLDGNTTDDIISTQTIVENADGSRDESTVLTSNDGTELSSSSVYTSADGQDRTVRVDYDGDGSADVVEEQVVTTVGTATSATLTVKNGDGSIRSTTDYSQSSDTLNKVAVVDEDGDGVTDYTMVDDTVVQADGVRVQTITVTNGDGSVRSNTQTVLAADKVSSETWVDLNQDGIFQATDKVRETSVDAVTQERISTTWDRNEDGSVNSVSTNVTSADGLSSRTEIDADNDGDLDLIIDDTTEFNGDGTAKQTVRTTARNGDLLSEAHAHVSADGLTVTSYSDIDGDGSWDAKTVSSQAVVYNASNEKDGTVQTVTNYAGDETTVLSSTQIEQSEDRKTIIISEDFDGDGNVEFVSTSQEDSDGNITLTENSFHNDGSLAGSSLATVSANGLVSTMTADVNGDGVNELSTITETSYGQDGSTTTSTVTKNGDGSERGSFVTTVSGNGMLSETKTDADGDGTFESVIKTETTLHTNGYVEDSTESIAANGSLLNETITTVSDDGLLVSYEVDADGDGNIDIVTTSVTTLGTINEQGSVAKDGGVTTISETRFANGDLRNGEMTYVSGDGREVSMSADVNGDGIVDQVHTEKLEANGDLIIVDRAQNSDGTLQSETVSQKSGNGLITTTWIDADGTGLAEFVVHQETTLNSDGSTTITTDSKSEDGTVYATNSHTISADGLTSIATEDWNADGTVDRTTVTNTELALNGVVTESIDITNADGNSIYNSTSTTSADGRNITIDTDADGNGVNDVETVVNTADSGATTSTSTYYTEGGGVDAVVKTVVSGDELSSVISIDANGDGKAELISGDVTALNQDGSIDRSIEHRNYKNITLASEEYFTSDDGLYSAASFDLDGDGTYEFITEERTVFENNGDVVQTMITQDAQYDTLAEITVTTSGNGLETEVEADFTGDGNVDRVHNLIVSADGSSFEKSLRYDGGSNLQSATTVTTSADGRTQVLTEDRDGDGNDDLRMTSNIDLDRTETVVMEDLNDDGSVKATVNVETLANGSQAIASFDVDGDGNADIMRSSNLSYDSAGNQTMTLTETFGNEGRVAYQETTRIAADGLSSTTTIDMDGDGNVDATASSITILNDDGSKLTEFNSTYVDGEKHFSHSHLTSADGRMEKTSHDFDGNGLADLETTYEVAADGVTVSTVNTFNEAGYELNSQITTTSLDGLTVTVKRGEITQTYTYSAVQNGSYTWDNGVEAQETGSDLAYPGYTNVVVSHEVDALGIETWTVTEQWKKNGQVQTNTYEVQLDATAKEEILAEAARIYDTLLDRDMDSSEIEMLAKFIEDGELNAHALAANILVGSVEGVSGMSAADGVFILQEYGASEAEVAALEEFAAANPSATFEDAFSQGFITAEQANLFFGISSVSGEFSIRYGGLSDSEFIYQIYLNAYGRAPSLEELEQVLEAFSSGAITQSAWALEIAESAEHLAVGNGHRITNNYDVILNPAEYERNLDEAYVRIQIEKLVDVVYDRDATTQEIAYLSELLMHGDGSESTISLDDIAQMLLDADGAISGVATNSLNGLSGEDLVTQAFINALGRSPNAHELQSWVSKIENGEISEAEFVAALSESLEHVAEGNTHVAVLPEPVVFDSTQTGTSNAENLIGTSNNDLLNGAAGNDTLSGKSGDDELRGMNGNDILYGDTGHDFLTGGGGWDDLHGGDGNDSLVGEGGKDDLYGGNGADSLAGGLDIDFMDGGKGSDIYSWETGDGNDTVHDTGSSQLETDTLHLTDVMPNEVVLVRNDGSYDLLIKIDSNGATSVITVKDHFQNSASGVGIEEIVFSDGTVWALDKIISNTSVVELEANNVLNGVSDFNETFYGFASDDAIDAKGGDDTLVGGVGADTLKGGDGADTYIWSRGDGDDTVDDTGLSQESVDRLILSDVYPEDVELSRSTENNHLIITISNPSGADNVITVTNRFASSEDGKGIEVIEFADGTIWDVNDFASKSVIYGTVGNDSLNGGSSGYDKVVDSGFGDDWVKTNSGDDTIDAGVGQDSAIGGEGNDTYVWSLGDAHYTDANGDFVVGNDIIDDASIALYETDRLELKEVDSDQVTLTRTSGSDDLIITVGTNGVGGTITVQNQFESVSNGKGIEEIAFADGVVWGLDDIITQTAVSGTSVGDALNGISDYDETFYGNAGADVIDANGGDDILVGGLGYDSLNGGNGNDLYFWSSGDGSDIVNDDGVSTSEIDTLVLTDINSADVTLLRNGEDLQVAIDEDHDGIADEVIVVQERFSANGNGSGIEIIEFADGVRTSVLSGTVAEAYVWGTGSSDGSLNGWAYTDTIYGFSGADSISGNGGDDLLVGGNGLDTLDGGAGSDTYHWSAGHGYDVIRDTDTDLAETDTLVFTDIASDDVLLTHDSGGNDLHITVLSTGEMITVEDQFVSTQNGKGLEAISFSDGVTWLLDDIYGYTSVLGDLEIDPQVSNSNQDTLTGVGDFDENFYGLTGNDTINAGAGDDFIVGGLGDDILNGGDGNDTYQWSTGSGEDEINDDGTSALETDRLVLNGVQPADVTLTRVSGTDDLLITIATTNGDKVLTVEGQFKDADAGYGLEAIEFSDGTVWLIADIIGNTLVQGDASDNTLIGESSFDETFEGYLGVDTINAGFGDDQISGGLGDDILDGEQGSDTYIWSSGDGDDVIDDDGTSVNDIDRLVLTNVDAADVMLERVVGSDDLTVVINGTARITLKDQYLSSSTTEGIEIIEFTDEVWSLDKILSSVVLVGSNSGETINASDLTDVIEGRGGADIINGKGGDDILIGGYGADTLNGGAGVDTASYEDAANGVEIDLGLMGPQIGGFGDVHKDDTLIDIENVTGSNLEDVLSGDDGANILTGNDGDDLISGGGGYDVINGGRGDDSLNGGSGKDEFIFAIGDGADFITDFEDALDVLIIEDLTFTDLVISQNGSDTLIELDSFTTITLEGVISSDVTEDDFQFV